MDDYKLQLLKSGYLKYLGGSNDIGFEDLSVGSIYKILVDSDHDLYIIDDAGDQVLLTDFDYNYEHLCEGRLNYFESAEGN